MPHAAGGRGARARADSVGAFIAHSTGQVFDGVGVHQDSPRVNVPKVSKQREIHSQEAVRGRCLHGSPLELCCAANPREEKKNPFCLAENKEVNDKSGKVQSGLENPESQSFQRVSARCSRSLLTLCAGMISLYMWTCLSSRPSCAQQRRRGGISKRSPTVRKWPSILPAQDRISQCLCNDNDLQIRAECPSLSDAHWKQSTSTVRTYPLQLVQNQVF